MYNSVPEIEKHVVVAVLIDYFNEQGLTDYEINEWDWGRTVTRDYDGLTTTFQIKGISTSHLKKDFCHQINYGHGPNLTEAMYDYAREIGGQVASLFRGQAQ